MVETPDSALSHIRVLELGGLPASYAGHYLAGLGAEVIKVEPPGGDPVRQDPPFVGDAPGAERGLKFIHLNVNKRSIVLDLGTEADKALFLDLARTVDAVVEGHPVGYLNGLGLGYERLSAVHPGIVVVSITPFGQTGQFRNLKGNNAIAEAMSGMIFNNGDDTTAPLASPNDFLTQIGGLHGASATLAAIYARRKGVGGQHVDISLQEAGTQVQTSLSEYSLRRTFRRRPGLGPLGGATSIYATRDGYVFVQPGQPHMWQALVDWMQDPILSQPEWKEREYQNQNADVLLMLIGNFIGSLTTDEFLEGAQSRGIPSAPINAPSQFVNSRHVQELGSFTEKTHPSIGAYETVDFMRLSDSPLRFRHPAPLLDQHRAEIIQETKNAKSASDSRTQPSTGHGTSPKLPLEGIRVLDFTRVIAGPAGTQVLGFLGADVIKVESRGLNTNREQSGNFPEINRAKKSITLDPRTPEGKELTLRLVEKSDIVINNFSAFVMDRLGLGYEEVKKVKKDIIYIRMPGFGRTGPLKDWVAFGQMLQSFTGLVAMWKYPESPMQASIKGPVADYISSSSVTMASMAAVEYRDRTGKGQIVELNMLEALASTLNPFYMDYLINKRDPAPPGYRSTRYAPYGGYPCRGLDEWCVIAVETEEEWKAFQKAIGEPGWAFDPRFQTKQGRIEHREELDANISTWTKEYTKHQVMHFLQRDGVPAGSIQSAEDVFYDYHLRTRGHMVEVANPAPWGTFELYGTPMRFSATPARDTAPTPGLGQHNEEIFRGLLGLTPEEYERLIRLKAIY